LQRFQKNKAARAAVETLYVRRQGLLFQRARHMHAHAFIA
jgi:hypothetical protein